MILTDVKIYAHDQVIDNGWIEIKSGKIINYGKGKKNGTSLKGLHLVPGFIDVHFHGSFGIDIMSTDNNGFEKLSKHLLENGVTSYLPTTLTDSLPVLNKTLKRLATYIPKQNKEVAQMVGIHLEGPFISPLFPGAQDKKFIIKPNIKKFEALNKAANGNIKYVTYAPELEDGSFTKYLAKHNIIASAGHSAANLNNIGIRMLNGLKNITHFNNAHSSYHHRNPGMVNAGLEFDNLNLELIVDKQHVHPSAIKLVNKIKTPDRILLITDACMATGLKDGTYKLGSQSVVKKENSIRLKDGTLAASLLTMNLAFKNMKEITKREIEDLVLMSSTNQAKLLGLNDRGLIKKGYRADLVLLDDKLNVKITILNGKIVYGKTN
jgi:N-acetylglucosamine-6-phosphate deacetylase